MHVHLIFFFLSCNVEDVRLHFNCCQFGIAFSNVALCSCDFV